MKILAETIKILTSARYVETKNVTAAIEAPERPELSKAAQPEDDEGIFIEWIEYPETFGRLIHEASSGMHGDNHLCPTSVSGHLSRHGYCSRTINGEMRVWFEAIALADNGQKNLALLQTTATIEVVRQVFGINVAVYRSQRAFA